MVLTALVKYWFIYHYRKCKVKYIEFEAMKVVLWWQSIIWHFSLCFLYFSLHCKTNKL